MVKLLLTACAVCCCLYAKSQHYHYQIQLENIHDAGEAKIATHYMIMIFDKQPRYDAETGFFSVWSETRILKTVFAEKSLYYGYKLGAFNVIEASSLYEEAKK